MRYSLILFLATATLTFACDDETSPTEPDGSSRDLATGDLARPDAQKPDMPPPFSGDKIDLLFVIDKSGSMEQEQENLAAQFPGLIEALRAPKYGGEGCSDQALDKCNIPDLHIGVKTNCEPGLDWLHKVEDYAQFFTQLKPPGGLILAAIAGPTEPVEVLKEDDLFSLKESCKTPAAGTAVPAIRIRALVEHPALVQQGQQGMFNPGGVNICSPNFLPAMKLLGEAIAAKLEG